MAYHAYRDTCGNNFRDSEHSGLFRDVSITFIEKTDPTNPLQRENY